MEGALHYAKYLSANYDVIAIAVSGTPDNYRIDTFAWEKDAYILRTKRTICKFEHSFHFVVQRIYTSI